MVNVPTTEKQAIEPDAPKKSAVPESRGLIKRVASGFGLKVSASACGFLLNVIIARLLGPVGTGYYSLSQSASVFGATIAKLGMDNTVIRLVASKSHDGSRGTVSVMRQSLRLCAAMSVLTTLALWLFAPQVARYLLDDPTATDVVKLVSIATAPLALSTLIAQGLIGMKRTNDGIIVNLLIIPLVGSVLSIFLVPMFKLDGAIYAYSISTLAALLYGQYLWKKATRGLDQDHPASMREILASCLPLFAVSLIQFVLKWSPVFLIKFWSSVSDVGIYNLAVRTAFLLTFILSAVNATTSPIFSELYVREEFEELGSLARRCAQAMAIIALFPLLAFLFFSRQVMGMYGHAFTAGGATLAVVAVGQYVNVAAGSVQQILVMTGREKFLGRIFAAMVIPYLLLMWWLTPAYGALGAGIATSAIMIAQNLICAYVVKRTLGIWTLPTWQELRDLPRIIRKRGLRRLLK